MEVLSLTKKIYENTDSCDFGYDMTHLAPCSSESLILYCVYQMKVLLLPEYKTTPSFSRLKFEKRLFEHQI